MDKNKLNSATNKVFLKGSIIGVLITIPSLTAFFVSWYVLGDKIMAFVVGAVVHFVGIGFSFKLSKKLFKNLKS